MSDARDTGAFARFLMAGMGQGIQLGQNADSMQFARERAGAADQNTAFQQGLQLEDSMLRRQQIAQAARDRVEQRERMERSRKANAQLVSLIADPNFQFNLSDPSVTPVLEDASPEVQSLVFRAAGDANAKKELAESAKRAQETYRAYTAMGGKYTLDKANDLMKMGILVDPKYIVKSQQETQAQQEAQDKEGYLVLLAEDFGVPPERIQKLQGASIDLVRKVYEDASTAKKAAAEAAQTQALQQQFLRDTMAAGANPAQMQARLSANRAGIPLGENPFGGQSDSALRAGLKQRIDAAKVVYDLAAKDAERLAEAVGADALTGKPTNEAVTGGWLIDTNFQSDDDRKLIAAYEAAKVKAESARRDYEALNQQAAGGGAIDANGEDPIQQQIDARAADLARQGVSPEEATKILEELERSLTGFGGQTMPNTRPR